MKLFSIARHQCKAILKGSMEDDFYQCMGYRGHGYYKHYILLGGEWRTWKDTDLRAVRNGRGERLDD